MAPSDRETTISFTDGDDNMNVYTENRKIKGKLKKLGFEPVETEGTGEFFEVPKEFMQFRKPRVVTEEQLERLREARKAAGVGEFREDAGKSKPKSKKAASKAKPAAKSRPAKDEDIDDEDDDEFEDEEETEEDVSDEEEDTDEDEDDDEDENPVETVSKPRGRKPAGKSASKAKSRKK